MAQWQMRLDFKQAKMDYADHKITIQEVAKAVIDEILIKLPQARKINTHMADQLEFHLLPLFEEMATDNFLNVDAFDDLLDELYDWADTSLDGTWNGKKMCWIVP